MKRSVMRNSPSSSKPMPGALVGVHQLHEVAAAADGGQLLVVDLVIEHGGVQPDPVVRELGLEAEFDRRDRLRVRDRRRAEEGDVAALDGRRAEADRQAAVDVDVVAHLEQRRQVPADLVVGDRQRVDRGADRAGAVQVLVVVGVTHAAGDGQRVGDVVADVAEHGPGRVLVRQRGRDRREERVGRDRELGVEVEGARLPEQRGRSPARTGGTPA